MSKGPKRARRKYVPLYDRRGYIRVPWSWGAYGNTKKGEIERVLQQLKKGWCVVDPDDRLQRRDCFRSKEAAQRWKRDVDRNRASIDRQLEERCNRMDRDLEAYGRALKKLSKADGVAAPLERLRQLRIEIRSSGKMCRADLARRRKARAIKIERWKPSTSDRAYLKQLEEKFGVKLR